MDYIVFDTEATGATNDTFGNPFTQSNKLCSLGAVRSGKYRDWLVDVGTSPYGKAMEEICLYASECPLLVGFVIKHDLHWVRRYGYANPIGQNLWDCQYAYFVMTGQKHKYPSLNEVAAHYGLGQKLDVVKTEYWDKGIDTDLVPPEILLEYQKQDVMLTEQVFLKQMEELADKPQLKRLIWYGCQDLKVTAEMEWNGIKYNIEKSMAIGNGLADRIQGIDQALGSIVPHVPINWNSDDHVSAILYGGIIPVDHKEDYEFVYKDPRKKPVIKQRTATVKHEFPRLIEPLKGTGLKKEGFWSVAEGVLRKLKPSGKAKEIIGLILERSTLETKRNRYYHGFPQLYKEMDWGDSLLHTNLNHVVAATGRLSSNKPNVQNLEELMRECVVTRFQ